MSVLLYLYLNSFRPPHSSIKDRFRLLFYFLRHLKHFVETVDCRFQDLFVVVDFVQIFVVDCRQNTKKGGGAGKRIS